MTLIEIRNRLHYINNVHKSFMKVEIERLLEDVDEVIKNNKEE